MSLPSSSTRTNDHKDSTRLNAFESTAPLPRGYTTPFGPVRTQRHSSLPDTRNLRSDLFKNDRFSHMVANPSSTVVQVKNRYNGIRVARIPFDGTDYPEYKVTRRMALLGCGLVKFISRPIPLHESEEDAAGRQLVYSILFKDMEPHQRHMVTSVPEGDCYGAWQNLSHQFQRHSRLNRRKFRRKFVNLDIKHYDSFGALKSDLIKTAITLTEMGEPVDDESKLTALLDAIAEEADLRELCNSIDCDESATFDEACYRIERFLHKKDGRGRGDEQLNIVNSSGSNQEWKSNKPCWNWERTGSCRRGARCKFRHGQEENKDESKEECKDDSKEASVESLQKQLVLLQKQIKVMVEASKKKMPEELNASLIEEEYVSPESLYEYKPESGMYEPITLYGGAVVPYEEDMPEVVLACMEVIPNEEDETGAREAKDKLAVVSSCCPFASQTPASCNVDESRPTAKDSAGLNEPSMALASDSSDDHDQEELWATASRRVDKLMYLDEYT